MEEYEERLINEYVELVKKLTILKRELYVKSDRLLRSRHGKHCEKQIKIMEEYAKVLKDRLALNEIYF